MKKILILFFLLICVSSVEAHQPRMVKETSTQVYDPEISQAFYGELNGEPHHFTIESDEGFDLYVSILIPDVESAQKDVSVLVTKNEQEILFLNASGFEWTYYWEEFGGDAYYQGPSDEMKAEKGVYDIRVYSPDNEGKYSLVVGRIESFPPKEILNAVVTMPQLKKFFEKSPLTAYFNLSGIFLSVMLIVILLFLYLAYWGIKKIKRSSKSSKKKR